MVGMKLSYFYAWLILLSVKSHKEERFMYVIYPLLCFNASFSLLTLQDILKYGILQISYLRVEFVLMLAISYYSAENVEGLHNVDLYKFISSEDYW
jgi:hypothetical protein